MPRNQGVRGVQWSTCDRCGFQWPINKLGYQKGLLVCYMRCWDDSQIERREEEIAQILNSGATTEGVDLRFIDAALAQDERGQ